MKRLLSTVIAFAVMGIAGTSAFALDLGGIKGTWQDSNYNANWTFSADGKIVLSDSKTGKEYFTFTESNIQDFDVSASTSGVTLSFSCKETGRSYKFKKGISLSTDLDMNIVRSWNPEAYDVTIKFQK